jgi:hypothetical protein
MRTHAHCESCRTALLISSSGDSAAASGLPADGEGSAAGGEDEWSEAWAEYKRECAEEAAEAAARGITDADVAAQSAPSPPPPVVQPLSETAKAQIKGVMANVKIKPPPWARKYVVHH